MTQASSMAVRTLLGAAPRYASLLKSQYWDRATFGRYTEARISRTLEAAAAIPFYAARFGGVPKAADLGNLAVLKREDIAALNRSVRSRQCFSRKPFTHGCTTGSTFMPAEFLFDASHQRGRLAARFRYLHENGWRASHRSAWIIRGFAEDTIEGKLIKTRLPLGASFLPISTRATEQADWLRKVDPLYLCTVPSNLELLLDVLAERGRRIPSLRRIFAGSEVLDASVREKARRVLGVDIADNYGATEAFLGWECPRGGLHVNAEHVYMEIVDDRGKPVPPGAMGKVVITTLENYLMPLVRYEVGDYAVAVEGRCGCGRTLPLIGRLVGRGVNLLRMPGGELLSPCGPVRAVVAQFRQIEEGSGLKRFQLVQRDVRDYAVRYVSERVLGGGVERLVQGALEQELGFSVSVATERVAELPRAPGGKFMMVVSEMAAAGSGVCR